MHARCSFDDPRSLPGWARWNIDRHNKKKERKEKEEKEAYRPLDVIAFESVHLSISCTFSHRPSFASSLFRMLVEGEGRGGKQASNEENGIWSK